MARGSLKTAVLSAVLVLAACSGDDDDSVGTGGSGGNAGQGTPSGSGGSTASGSSGRGASGSTSSGGAGQGGSAAGSAGASTAGRGGGTAKCDPACPTNRVCQLVEVTCVRAPCDPVPMCVEDTGDAGSGSAGSGDAGSGDAGSGSAGSGSAGSGGSGRTCGTRGTGSCPDGEFCDFPATANCGRADAAGKCAPQTSICTREFNPVCGCDGMTYSNACTAHAAGVSVETEGECGGTAAKSTRCVGAVTCPAAAPAPCPDGEARTIVDACFGPCVAIDSCECAGPDDCPDHDKYTCHMSAKHCGPYV